MSHFVHRSSRARRTAMALATACAATAVLGTASVASAASSANTVAAHHHYAFGAKLPSAGAKHSAAAAHLSHADVARRLAALSPLPHASAAKTKADGVDLSQYAIDPGNQGQVNSCVSWAIDYSGMSVLENEQGISGGPQAPMYTYAQIVKGQNTGTWPADTLAIAEDQGVDSREDYTPGDFDYTTQPTDQQRENAAHWKLSGHTQLHTGSGIQQDVQQALSNGEPVAISIPVYQSFQDMSQQQAQDYSYAPASGEQSLGGHEITIIGYDSQGVRVQNSWGTNWGDAGFVNLSWDFLTNQVEEANAIGKLVQ